MVPVDGRLVAVDSEIIEVVPARSQGHTIEGRRVHAGLCLGYQIQAEKDQTRKEMRAFTARQGKGRRGGL